MCGLLFSNDPRVLKAAFLDALKLMHHRGPDAAGYFQIGQVQLGLARLKIQDLESRSDQPFLSADGRFVIVFNGEIYNFRELAKQHSIDLRTSCDTEVVIELYAKYGAKCLTWLEGMFAFVITNISTGETFAARDRLGVKPLYFHNNQEKITFASEIASLLHLAGPGEFDITGLRQYRKLRAFFNGRTLYRHISMFPPGHYMSDGQLRQYWCFPDVQQDPPGDEELEHLITTSVRDRLVADVPVGSYLSGGLDSTIVATLAGKVHTWTVGFAEDNEFEWAEIAARRIASEHHEVLIAGEEFTDLAKEMIRRRREPLSVPNEVLIYKMTLAAKKENKVILSGEGADELFFGYNRIFAWAEKSSDWRPAEFDNMYSYGSHQDPDIVEEVLAPFVARKKPIKILEYFFQTAHLHGLLRRLDNSSMLASVEARVPFVDAHALVERLAGTPYEWRCAGGVVKAPLKRVYGQMIPLQVIEREKVGFPVPPKILNALSVEKGTAMDRWLDFNISEIVGVPVEAADLK